MTLPWSTGTAAGVELWLPLAVIILLAIIASLAYQRFEQRSNRELKRAYLQVMWGCIFAGAMAILWMLINFSHRTHYTWFWWVLSVLMAIVFVACIIVMLRARRRIRRINTAFNHAYSGQPGPPPRS